MYQNKANTTVGLQYTDSIMLCFIMYTKPQNLCLKLFFIRVFTIVFYISQQIKDSEM